METISSIELPLEDNYRLTKISSNNNKSSVIEVNDKAEGTIYYPIIELDKTMTILWSKPNSAYATTTSAIKKIELTPSMATVIIHTQNSVYELTNMDMLDDPSNTSKT